MKRLQDLTVTLAILPLAIILILSFGTLVFILNRENPLFIQQRVGLHGRPFNLIKLRTMSSGTKNLPTHLIKSTDISALGRIMRAAKVDELPQLYNVLKGDMSLVGPRPCLPTQIDLIQERSKLGVYDLRPGITGYAQIRGIDMSVPTELAKADQAYLLERNSILDIKLLFLTVLGKGRGDKTV